VTKIVVRDGLAWRYEGEVLVTLTPGECADAIERLQGIQRDFHNLDDLAAIKQLHAAVKTAQELAATRLMEIERLKKLLNFANREPPHCPTCNCDQYDSEKPA